MLLEPRQHTPLWMTISAPIIAVAIVLILSGGLIAWAGAPLLDSYIALIVGAFGSKFAIAETLVRATPLILTGLAAAVAFRAKLWNIGGEGQLYAGALAVTYFGTGLIELPSFLMIPFLFFVGAVAGGLLLLFPALLKTKLKVDEVVTTLLLNFVVLLFANYLLFGPWKDPMAMGWPQGAPVIEQGILENLVAKTRLHAGLIFSVLAAVCMWLVMSKTKWGLEIRAVGHNQDAAKFAGIPINKTIIRTALISGGLAACAGVTEVAGTKEYLTLDISPGFGYTGIAVAMLAGLNPLGVILAALFFAGIYNGADSMSRAMNVSNYIADVITAGSLLMVMLAVMLTRMRIRLKG
ncbi:ABC transporter permease [Sneathiella sp. P13V-1]|uniref:ABC transporter permease n=1 Tax=Sneathiella sp. P13V-1 TaxID=2697366 RepID=UPI00187B325B|nr:ABC transporter permease [Sneathiella sp. P13V-1]MBE7635231.1 ABC transporter permease [Sneathiella sp. P13V-1]